MHRWLGTERDDDYKLVSTGHIQCCRTVNLVSMMAARLSYQQHGTAYTMSAAQAPAL